MSRIARKPLNVPSGVEFKQQGNLITIKGPKGQFEYTVHKLVAVAVDGNVVLVAPKENHEKEAKAMVGTTRVLLENFVHGVHQGFEKKLELRGVGYRAKVQGKTLEMTLGHSHPIKYPIPEGITIESPSNTEVVVKGACKQQVGQIAAEIRSKRPPEPYKGKGVRYANEHISLKETKKK